MTACLRTLPRSVDDAPSRVCTLLEALTCGGWGFQDIMNTSHQFQKKAKWVRPLLMFGWASVSGRGFAWGCADWGLQRQSSKWGKHMQSLMVAVGGGGGAGMRAKKRSSRRGTTWPTSRTGSQCAPRLGLPGSDRF